MSRNLLGRRFPCIILSLLSLLPLFALAIPTPPARTPQPYTEKRQLSSNEDCGFKGDDNTYGLGIRIGVYLQWITSAIAYSFIPEEAMSLRGVNNCFQAAMFAGLLFITITKGSELYAVEAYIMLIFCMGGVCSGDNKDESGKFKQKKFAYYRASTPGGLIRFGLSAGFCGYGLWFFFKGMDGMQHPPCSTYAYFFAKVNLYNWLRTFMKVVFVLMAITHALIIFWPVVVILLRCSTNGLLARLSKNVRPENANPNDGSGNKRTSGEEPRDQKPVNPMPVNMDPTGAAKIEDVKSESTKGGLVLLSGSLLSFILTVELMIKWNNIHEVNEMGSTGQLLPLIIAIGGFFRILHQYRIRGRH